MNTVTNRNLKAQYADLIARQECILAAYDFCQNEAEEDVLFHEEQVIEKQLKALDKKLRKYHR